MPLNFLGNKLWSFRTATPEPRARAGRASRCRVGAQAGTYTLTFPLRRISVQEMVIYGVSFDMVGKQPIVLLKTVDGNKFLPIWIGHPEAASILMKLQGAGHAAADDPRPALRHPRRARRQVHAGVASPSCARTRSSPRSRSASPAASSRSTPARATRSRSRSAPARRSTPPRRSSPSRRSSSSTTSRSPRTSSRSSRSSSTRSRPRTSPQATPEALSASSALARIRSTSSSKPMPAASAASGSRLVSVRPGHDVRLEHPQLAGVAPRASGRRARRRGSRAARTSRSASSWARSVVSAGSSAGQTNVVMPIS